jgi:hypothetical protein
MTESKNGDFSAFGFGGNRKSETRMTNPGAPGQVKLECPNDRMGKRRIFSPSGFGLLV